MLCKTGNRLKCGPDGHRPFLLVLIRNIVNRVSHITPCPSLNLGLIGEKIFQEKTSSTRVENTLQIVYLESFVMNASDCKESFLAPLKTRRRHIH